MKANFFIISFMIILSACASKPQLYPNDHLKRVGKEKASQDIDECIAEAKENTSSGQGKKALKGAGVGAVVGGAMGAVGGLLGGGLVRGAIRGSAIGGAGGAAYGAMSPDDIRRRYVNICLDQKGYQVIGWD